MKKTILILIFGLSACLIQAQNSIGIQVGYLGTYTSIAEYERINRMDFLLDSMSLSKNVGSVSAAINLDVDLGKNFFLSTGFRYANKGLANVTFTDSTGWPWQTAARQKYLGLSVLAGYRIRFHQSKFGLLVATGLQADFAIGTPNPGTLFSGPYYRFFLPFSQFSEVDLSWISEAGVSYKLGPGEVVGKLTYLFGMSDVMEDPWVVGRSMSFGISAGYSLPLSK